MQQNYFFKNAKWVGAADPDEARFSILRGHFTVKDAAKVSLNVLGLGFFKCYINGICINPDTFLPLSSDFEATCDPKDEVLSGHRIYVPQFDITPFVQQGDNVIAIHYGGGWYTFHKRRFGRAKAIYCVCVEEQDGTAHFVSNEDCRIGKSYIADYNFVNLEKQDLESFADCFGKDFDDRSWENASLATPVETEYCTTDCPTDALIETLDVKEIAKTERGVIYDCGVNTVGYPTLRLCADKGETVTVRFGEELTAEGALDHIQRQHFYVISNGEKRTVSPEFTWFGFRYFEIEGDAKPLGVKVVHANIKPSSTFDSDNETLNWIYRTFMHTMLCNMHTGHPSDCPHLERRGYTGDGQLTCHAVLSTLDARAFYEKWMQDIADGQDILTGHVQYTAPFIHSGGGPGGWGGAIVIVPYQLYKHYGDKEILKKYYANMRRYIDYMEAHCEFGLVTSDKQGDWCLGDWCGPVILYPDKGIYYSSQQMILPAAMVNTYFLVKSLMLMREIAEVIDRECDLAEYDQKIETHSAAIRAAYFNAFDNNFLINAQGANAYGVDLGLGTEKTYTNMVDYYKKIGHYDTGIFATDILTRVLFEKGDAELAVSLLTGHGPHGFAHWMENGATTFHEYWDSTRSRSHNPPMFGAPVAYFFEYLLGIGQEKGTAGYQSLVIAPQAVSCFGRMSGSMETPSGTIAVGYVNDGDGTQFKITIPAETKAILRFADQEFELNGGENCIRVAKIETDPSEQ